MVDASFCSIVDVHFERGLDDEDGDLENRTSGRLNERIHDNKPKKKVLFVDFQLVSAWKSL